MEYRRLRVSINGAVKGDVFTDVYLEKGADSNCLRYHLEVEGERRRLHGIRHLERRHRMHQRRFHGYYSYVDKLRNGHSLLANRFTQIGVDEVGVCHIAPVLTRRDGTQTDSSSDIPFPGAPP